MTTNEQKWMIQIVLEATPQDAVMITESLRHKPQVADTHLVSLSDLEMVNLLRQWALNRADHDFTTRK